MKFFECRVVSLLSHTPVFAFCCDVSKLPTLRALLPVPKTIVVDGKAFGFTLGYAIVNTDTAFLLPRVRQHSYMCSQETAETLCKFMVKVEQRLIVMCKPRVPIENLINKMRFKSS